MVLHTLQGLFPMKTPKRPFLGIFSCFVRVTRRDASRSTPIFSILSISQRPLKIFSKLVTYLFRLVILVSISCLDRCVMLRDSRLCLTRITLHHAPQFFLWPKILSGFSIHFIKLFFSPPLLYTFLCCILSKIKYSPFILTCLLPTSHKEFHKFKPLSIVALFI